MSLDDVGCRADIFKTAARASCDDALFYIELSVADLVLKGVVHRAVQAHQRLLLYIVENIFQVCIYLVDRVYIARMERHRDHRLDLA